MKVEIPKSVSTQYDALYHLMEKNPERLSIAPLDAAKVMGMDVECLKNSAYQGKCPFAVGGDDGPHTSRFTKIPKLPFFNFMMQGYWQFEMYSMMQDLIEKQNAIIREYTEKDRMAIWS